MATGSSRFTHVSLGSLEEKINLNPRQLQLLEQRRHRLNGKVEKKLLPSKPSVLNNRQQNTDPQKKWDLEHAGTAPTASWESSASEASSAAASSNPQKAFYGSRLEKKERKKMYDDTGASYYESMSEASSSTVPSAASSSHHRKLKPSTTDVTEALTKSSSHESHDIASQEPSSREDSVPPMSTASTRKDVDVMKAHLKKRLLANMAEKRKSCGKPLPPSNAASKNTFNEPSRRQSLALNRPKTKGGAPDDQQRAFLRNLIQSAYQKPDDQQSQVMADKETAAKMDSKSSVVSSKSGAASSCASAEEKAIMRKVLERNNRRKTPSTSSKPSFVKTASARMMKAFSPRECYTEDSIEDAVPTSPTVISEQRRVSPRSRKTVRRGKKSRSPRFRNAISRWSGGGGGSGADDESESIKVHDLKKQNSNSTTEEASELSDSDKISVSKLEIPLSKTITTKSSSAKSIREGLSVDTPDTVDVKPQTTEVSALSRPTFETFHNRETKEEAANSGDAPSSSRLSDVSRPSILTANEREVQRVERNYARAVVESLMEPVDLGSPNTVTADTVPFETPQRSNRGASIPSGDAEHNSLSNNAQDEGDGSDDDGYSEFVATLKAEVSSSHSLLWKSFHGLFTDAAAPALVKNDGNCHFDDKTKALVKDMSSFIKKNHNVPCVTGTQLSNDKSVRENKFPHSKLQKRFVTPSLDEYDSDKENGMAQNVEVEVTLNQFVRKNHGTSNDSAPATKKAPLKPPASTKSLKSALKPSSYSTPKSNGDSSAPWSDVKLRSVAEIDKSEATGSSIPTSWAKVKLRPVSTKSEKQENVGGHSNIKDEVSIYQVDEDASDFRRIVVSKKKAFAKGAEEKSKTPRSEGGPGVVEIIDLADIASTAHQPIDLTNSEEDPIDLTDKTNEDQPIDLTQAQTPRTISGQSLAETKVSAFTAVTADGSVLVSLAPEINSEPVKVLIGRRGLLKIRTQPGETKARVVWKHELDDIQSALLDLASFKVKLFLHSSSDHKDLAFATADACMKFANALHELTNTSTSEGDDKSEAISVEESIFVEQLNEEEQRVLEEFRQSKNKQDPPEMQQLDTTFERPMSVINTDSSGPHSPMSEISGPGAALSGADLRLAESYQKMLKLKIPKDAVRHKMEQDHVKTKIVDFVLGGDSDTPPSQDTAANDGLSAEDEKVAASYRKMLKMRIPAEAVRHKMEKEGVKAHIIRAVIGGDQPAQTETKSTAVPDKQSLTAEEEVIAAPYKKMLKMMIPKEAVEHKMKKEQVDPKIIAIVLGNPISAANQTNKTSTKPGVPALTDEEESVASSYRKMLSLRIPKEAVRQKMESENISNKIIASVLGESVASDNKKGSIKRGGKQGFHWKPVDSNENLQKSVWSKASFDSSFLDDDVTISSQVEQFQKKPDSDEASRITTKNTGDSKDKAKLIDLSRANNIAITLKAFGEFSHKELAQIIEYVDPFGKIKGDRALFMKDLLPAAAEIKVIKSYTGGEDRLVPAEKWFQHVVHIKRVEDKIQVLRTMESFRNEAIALGDTFQQLTKVCNQVMTSDKLPDLLEMVRQIGNRMNHGRGQEAAGFKLDFLPRLAQTKGSDKKTTALDLVVMIFNTRNSREALKLGDDFPGCYEASRLQIGELIADVKMIGTAMKKCQKELNSIERENGNPQKKRVATIGDCHSESGIAFSTQTSDSHDDEVRTQVSNVHEELFKKRSQMIFSALSKESKHSGATKKSINRAEKSYSHQGAINRIANFLDEAHIIYKELELKRDRALAACTELAEFFCESGGERIAPTLLGILAEFASNLNKALEKYDRQQKADTRKKQGKEDSSQQQTKSGAHAGQPSNRSTYRAEKKSLVLMVNEMLKIAGDKQRDDFVNGVTYKNPDSRLKEIYEAEKKFGKPSGGSPATQRKNILRTIAERRDIDGTHDSQAALSELAQAMQRRTASTDSLSPSAHGSVGGFSIAMTPIDSSSNAGGPVRNTQRLSIAERWTRKCDQDDEKVEGDHCIQIQPSANTQSLACESQDSEDLKYQERKRQEYLNRWARKKEPEVDNESDVGALLDYHSKKTRQKYIDRWASKVGD